MLAVLLLPIFVPVLILTEDGLGFRLIRKAFAGAAIVLMTALLPDVATIHGFDPVPMMYLGALVFLGIAVEAIVTARRSFSIDPEFYWRKREIDGFLKIYAKTTNRVIEGPLRESRSKMAGLKSENVISFADQQAWLTQELLAGTPRTSGTREQGSAP